MGRRKKEPTSAHRQYIATAAHTLFFEKGIAATTMDEIAQTAGYSKATLYVYFQNKEEIVGMLVLESMKKLHEYLSDALQQQVSFKEKYRKLTHGLVKYHDEFPFYFQMALEKINIEFEQDSYLPEEKETFQIGEKITEQMTLFLDMGMEAGEIRKDIPIVPTIFVFWSMLSGLILTSVQKEAYIETCLHQSRQAFLEYGFDTLYRSIAIDIGGEKDE